jgi:MtN3 and saliva related transmembrane protein
MWGTDWIRRLHIMAQYLGFAAGVFTTFCYVPQLMRVFRLKSAKEISTIYTILILLGTGIWLVYGILIKNPPLMIWNAIAFVFLSLLLTAKLLYGRSEPSIAAPKKESGAKKEYQKV